MRDHDTQEFDTSRGGSNTPLWFIAGAVAGAAAALLFAPASGQETRAYVGRRSREAADELRERGREVMHEAAGRGRELWQEHGEPIVSAMKKEYEKVNGTEAGPV